MPHVLLVYALKQHNYIMSDSHCIIPWDGVVKHIGPTDPTDWTYNSVFK